MMNEKLVHNFKSYIGLDNIVSKNGDKNGSVPDVRPKFKKGEAEAGGLRGVALVEGGTLALGALFVTNYRLYWAPYEPGRRAPLDLPLGLLAQLWATDGAAKRVRRLLPLATLPHNIKGLQIVAKDMRVVTFSLRGCGGSTGGGAGAGRTLATALLHHAFPKRHNLLFAYDCTEPGSPPHTLSRFVCASDWAGEVERCYGGAAGGGGAAGWRVSCHNGTSDRFTEGAGEALVVPAATLDCALAEAARHFRGGRVPVWVWGCGGAALVRCADAAAGERAHTLEGVLLEQVRRAHPARAPPALLSLAPPALPALPALRLAHARMLALHTPPSLHSYWAQDGSYYARLERSRWLHYVSAALSLAARAATLLTQHDTTVVLQEESGCDWTAVVSSVAQVLSDPEARTVRGLHAVIHKEWLALAHPFATRHALVRAEGRDAQGAGDAEAPVFLVFVECVWHCVRQAPAAFQYSAELLVTLADHVHDHMFTTFLFDSPRHQHLAILNGVVGRSVLEWEAHLPPQRTRLHYNPLYRPVSGMVSVSTELSALEVWSQYWQRWLAPLQGGVTALRAVTHVAAAARGDLAWAGPGRFYPWGCGAGAGGAGAPALHLALDEGAADGDADAETETDLDTHSIIGLPD